MEKGATNPCLRRPLEYVVSPVSARGSLGAGRGMESLGANSVSTVLQVRCRNETRAGLRYDPNLLALYDLADHRGERVAPLQGADERRGPILRHRHEQSAARLRVVEG
jgi:hypothetical protein